MGDRWSDAARGRVRCAARLLVTPRPRQRSTRHRAARPRDLAPDARRPPHPRASLLAIGLVLSACGPTTAELLLPDGARAAVLAAPPDLAVAQPLDGTSARAGAVSDGDALIAILYAQDLATLGLPAGPLGDSHPPLPAPLAQHVLDAGADAWRPLDALPEWLTARLQPTCPPLATSIVAVATTTRGVELYTRLDGARALARIGDRLVTIDAEGRIEPASSTVLPFVGDAHTDGARVWMLGGRWGAATGRMMEGRVDAAEPLVVLEPPGWPPEAGFVRRVDGGRDRTAPPEIVVATDLGWLLAYDGERWSVRFRPGPPVDEANARVVWLAPDHVALNPAYLDGPRLLEVIGGAVVELAVAEPRALAEPERIFSLGRGLDGSVLAGGTEGRAYRFEPGARTSSLLAEVGGEVHAIGESARQVWTYGPLGLSRIDRASGVACPAVEGTAFSGTGTMVALDGAVLVGGGDVIQRATVPR